MKSGIVAEPPLRGQHFFRIVCGCRRGLLDAKNLGKLFLIFSDGSRLEFNSEARTQINSSVATCSRRALDVTTVLLIPVSQQGRQK